MKVTFRYSPSMPLWQVITTYRQRKAPAAREELARYLKAKLPYEAHFWLEQRIREDELGDLYSCSRPNRSDQDIIDCVMARVRESENRGDDDDDGDGDDEPRPGLRPPLKP